MQLLLGGHQCRLDFIKAASVLLRKNSKTFLYFTEFFLKETSRVNINTILYILFPSLYFKATFQQCSFAQPVRQQSRQYRISQVSLFPCSPDIHGRIKRRFSPFNSFFRSPQAELERTTKPLMKHRFQQETKMLLIFSAIEGHTAQLCYFFLKL